MQAQYLVDRSLCFYFSLKYVRWLYVQSEGHITTYRYFFAQVRKMPLNLIITCRAPFGMDRCLYLFQIARFSQKFQILVIIVRWLHVQSTYGTCHHARD